jgi:hypothetical protein
MTWHKKPKTKEQVVDNMREIMSIPDDLILKWLDEAAAKSEKKNKK